MLVCTTRVPARVAARSFALFKHLLYEVRHLPHFGNASWVPTRMPTMPRRGAFAP